MFLIYWGFPFATLQHTQECNIVLLQKSSLVNGHNQPAVSQVPRSQLLQPPHQIAQRHLSGKLLEFLSICTIPCPFMVCCTYNKMGHIQQSGSSWPSHYLQLPCTTLPSWYAGPVQNGRKKPILQQAEPVRKPHLQNGATQPEAIQRPAGQPRSMAPPPHPRASHPHASASRYSAA